MVSKYLKHPQRCSGTVKFTPFGRAKETHVTKFHVPENWRASDAGRLADHQKPKFGVSLLWIPAVLFFLCNRLYACAQVVAGRRFILKPTLFWPPKEHVFHGHTYPAREVVTPWEFVTSPCTGRVVMFGRCHPPVYRPSGHLTVYHTYPLWEVVTHRCTRRVVVFRNCHFSPFRPTYREGVGMRTYPGICTQ